MQNVPGRRPQQAEDFIRLQDLMYLCLVRWRWFVISLVVTLGIATYYLLSTPSVYQRTASILIKEDGNIHLPGDRCAHHRWHKAKPQSR